MMFGSLFLMIVLTGNPLLAPIAVPVVAAGLYLGTARQTVHMQAAPARPAQAVPVKVKRAAGN